MSLELIPATYIVLLENAEDRIHLHTLLDKPYCFSNHSLIYSKKK